MNVEDDAKSDPKNLPKSRCVLPTGFANKEYIVFEAISSGSCLAEKVIAIISENSHTQKNPISFIYLDISLIPKKFSE